MAIVYTDNENWFAGFHSSQEAAEKHCFERFGDVLKGVSYQEVHIPPDTSAMVLMPDVQEIQ